MTKSEYWQAHVRKNPKLADENGTVQVKVSTLKRLMEEAYDKGCEHGVKVGGKFKDIFNRLDDITKGK